MYLQIKISQSIITKVRDKCPFIIKNTVHVNNHKNININKHIKCDDILQTKRLVYSLL